MICCEAVDPGTLGVFVTNEFNTIRNYSMGLLEHKHVTRLPLVVNNQNHIPALGHSPHSCVEDSITNDSNNRTVAACKYNI
jgi:hypothetical protein